MNKSLIVACALVLGTTLTYGQTSSGNMMVGGGLEFESVSYKNGSSNNESNVTFSPSFGYFVSDNLAVGATLVVGSYRDGTGSGKTVTSRFGLGPFARYYIPTSNDRFCFFGQAQLTFISGKTDPPSGRVTKSNEIDFALSPGFAYFFNDHWAVEFAIRGFGIRSVNPDTDEDDGKYTEVGFGLNSLSPSIGFRYHF